MPILLSLSQMRFLDGTLIVLRRVNLDYDKLEFTVIESVWICTTLVNLAVILTSHGLVIIHPNLSPSKSATHIEAKDTPHCTDGLQDCVFSD